MLLGVAGGRVAGQRNSAGDAAGRAAAGTLVPGRVGLFGAAAATGAPGSGAPAPVAPAPPLTAAAALLMDAKTGQVLHEKNGFTARPPASTTKVLTALVALEQGKLDAQVEISPRAAHTEGSSMYLRAGERYTLRELLYGLLLNSGNDAAVAIAEHLAGSVEAFAGVMNARARAAGAKHSHFVNPHGLNHPDHYSTAHDLALITRAAFNQPVFAEIVRQREAELLLSQAGRTLRLHNTNRLLGLFEGADGVKTGTTSAAGACLISSATRSGETGTEQKLIAVVLNADARWRDSIRLLEWGYTTFHLVEWAAPGEVVTRVLVRGGQEPTVALAAGGYLAAVLARGVAPAAVLEWDLSAVMAAPVQLGQVIGTARVRVGSSVQTSVPLVAAKAVRPATWSTRVLSPWLELIEWLGRRGWL